MSGHSMFSEAERNKSVEKIVDGFNNYLSNALIERNALRDCLVALRAEVIPFGPTSASLVSRVDSLLRITETFDGERSLASTQELLATVTEGVQCTARAAKTINANDRVKVKLTNYGLRLMEANCTSLRIPFHRRPIDVNGYTEFALWEVMQEFGPHIHMGAREHPFEMTMVLV